MIHLPCLIFELGDEHLLREEVGYRVRPGPSEEGTTNRQGEAALDLNRSSAIPDGYLRFHLALPVAEASELFHEGAAGADGGAMAGVEGCRIRTPGAVE